LYGVDSEVGASDARGVVLSVEPDAPAEPEEAYISDDIELSSDTQPLARETRAYRERPERLIDTRPGRLRFDSGGKAERASPPRRQASPSGASFASASGSAPARTDAEASAGEAPLAVPTVTKAPATAVDTPEQRIPLPDGVIPRNGKPSKLQFGDEEKSVAAPAEKILAKARSKAERSSERLASAQEKLPAKRRVSSRLVFNENKGKPKRELYFENEIKSQRELLKGHIVTRPVKAGANAAIAYGHRKIYMAEGDNLGVKAAHRAELLAESGLRASYRAHKTAPYRKVERLTRKSTKLNMKADYSQAIKDNPKLKSSSLSRASQKRKIQRQYAKAARDAERSARSVKNIGSFVDRSARSVGRAVTRHPVALIVIASLGLVIALISGAFASCGSIVSGGGSLSAAGRYLAEDSDIDMAELSYTEWETDLQLGIMNAETDKPGFDEYRYSVGDASHNPYELMAYLTAKFQAFKYPDIESELRDIFDEQYHLTYTEAVETRYADPDDVNEDDDLELYVWSVLTVTLTARSFTDVITGRLGSEQLQNYSLLMQTNGSKQYVGSPFDFNWLPYVSSNYGWRVHPVTAVKDNHRGVDIAVQMGTDILAANAGTVSVGYDAGGYGNYITITGSDGLVTKYAHCEAVRVTDGQSVNVGEVIARVGSTGQSTGAHLHFEVMKDGVYLNPLYFSETAVSRGIRP
jgi:murein DD-endopeptidase MepM/ murein hydrolase activator NlpD